MKFRILSLDGGGTWALIQARVLQDLYGTQARGHAVLRNFDMVVANSGGSLVAAGLAENLALDEILGMFLAAETRGRIFVPLPWHKKLNPLRLLGVPAPRFSAADKLEGLKKLQPRGCKLDCQTNKPTAFALPLLQKKGLSAFFSKTFGGDAFERMKPDPLPLLKTCEALGTLPAHTLMIGDSSNDALAARAAGCPVMLVTYGYNHGVPVHTVDADGFLNRIDAL